MRGDEREGGREGKKRREGREGYSSLIIIWK